MTNKLVLTIGNELMGDDAAGPLLARMLEDSPLPDWQVLDGGNAPENHLFKVRDMKPDAVLVVDAADMQLRPGEVRLIDKDSIGGLFLMTTHSLPLTFLMDAVREFVPKVELLGIQPEVVAFGYPVSPAVLQAVERIYAGLKSNLQFAVINDKDRDAGVRS